MAGMICGTGSYIPSYTMDNNDIAKLVDTSEKAVQTAGSIELIPQYDYESGSDSVMKAEDLFEKPTPALNPTVHNAIQKGDLYVAPVARINEQKDAAWTPTPNTDDYWGIVRGNMFKFVNTQYGMTAVEVAGKYADSHSDENNGIYEWQYHDLTAGTPKLTKALGQLKVSNTKNLWVTNSTKIMVRSSDDNKVITCYNGLSALPGDVLMTAGTEVDWVDFNGDDRVDYVYLTGRVSGTITYGLFYYNGGEAVWNGTDGTGTLTGWLNGEATTVTFNDQAMFNIIKDHTSNVETLNYRAHLFALQIMNGVVNDVMVSAPGGTVTTGGYYLLATTASAQNTGNLKDIAALTANTAVGGDTTVTTEIKTGNTAAEMFGLGGLSAKWGNPYKATTGLAYHRDVEDAPAANEDVVYNPGTSTVTVNTTGADTVYYITDNTKIIGLGRGVSYGENVLYYLNECDNDVTVVYETDSGNKVALEIYVATDPDWTPNGTDPVVASKPVAGPHLVPIPAGPTANVPTTNVQLKNLIKTARNTVIFSTNFATPDSTVVSDMGGGDVLWFPYGSPGASVPVGLVIYDSNNVPVCTMTGTSNADSTKSNFLYMTTGGVGADWIDNNAVYSGSLKAGVYTFVLTNKTTQDVLSQGTFTMQ